MPRNGRRCGSLHVREEDVEAAMLNLAGPQPIALHADLGTGTGSVLKSFARLASQSIGIDSSREMLAMARAQLDQAGIRHAQVRHGDIYALPFSDASADFVTIHQVLHFLDDPARAVAEAARILKPGGRILIAISRRTTWNSSASTTPTAASASVPTR